MMYSQQSLPKAYGSAYGRSKSGGAGVVSSVALVVLLVLSGGLSLVLVSTRSQLRDMKLHHEAVSEDLTYTKNHLHHVEAQLANKQAEYQHLQEEVNQYTAHHSIQELESLRNQKRVNDQAIATHQDEMTKLKEELDAAHALIDAYKHHLSDEVASHHQREETWLQVQQDWEKLEQEFQAEIDSLRAQLSSAHVKVAEPAHVEHHHPQHVAPEVVHHDPLLDNLPSAHLPAPAGAAAHHAAGTPAAAAHAGHHAGHHAPAYHAATPAAGHQQQQQHAHYQHVAAPVPPHVVSTPPHPAEVPHTHHDDHYAADAHHAAAADAGAAHHDTWQHHDWAPTDSDYGKVFDAHNLYADYPGFVDETQHHDDAQHYAHDDQAHHDVHDHAHAGHLQQQQHHDALHEQHGASSGGHHAAWQHHDDAHHFQADASHHPAAGGAHTTQQQQQQQHAQQQQYHAAAAGSQQHAAGAGAAAGHQQAHHEQQHHVVDDLAMKLGLGGHYDEPAQYHH